MSDTVENKNTPDTDVSQEELLMSLKRKADTLGIVYNPRIGIEKLQVKIEQFLAEAEEAENVRMNSPSENQFEKIARLRREAAELVRVRINCLNPMKKNWPGEIISVGNSKIGTFKKMVPFNLETGYHVPKMIFNYLKTRKFQVFQTIKGRNGKPDRKQGKLIPEFSVELLSNLTQKELDALAKSQAVNSSIDQD